MMKTVILWIWNRQCCSISDQGGAVGLTESFVVSVVKIWRKLLIPVENSLTEVPPMICRGIQTVLSIY